ncbi:MAG: type IV secretion system protein [Rhodopila sp.]
MRRALIIGTILTGAWLSPAQAQIPVTDVSAIAQLFQQYSTQLKQLATEAQQLETAGQQLGYAVNTFNSLVDHPNLATAMGLLNQLGISDPLPVNPYAVQSLINGQGGINGSLGSLSTLANSAAAANHVYTPRDNTWASQQMIANANGIAGGQGIAQQVYQQISARFPVLQALQRDALAATTPAEREHVANQIAAEQAWAQNAQGQLQSTGILMAAERDSRQQRIDEHLTESADNQISQAKAEGIIP